MVNQIVLKKKFFLLDVHFLCFVRFKFDPFNCFGRVQRILDSLSKRLKLSTVAK